MNSADLREGRSECVTESQRRVSSVPPPPKGRTPPSPPPRRTQLVSLGKGDARSGNRGPGLSLPSGARGWVPADTCRRVAAPGLRGRWCKGATGKLTGRGSRGRAQLTARRRLRGGVTHLSGPRLGAPAVAEGAAGGSGSRARRLLLLLPRPACPPAGPAREVAARQPAAAYPAPPPPRGRQSGSRRVMGPHRTLQRRRRRQTTTLHP